MHTLIVGAGVAGLTCGRLLAAHGHRVTILEADGGVGGRVRSDYINGYTLDRGFQVLFDVYPAAQRLLDLAALDLRPFDPGALICLGGRRATLTDPLRDAGAAFDAALTPIVPFADKLRTLQLALMLREQSIEQLLAGEDATTLEYLRAYGFDERTIDRFFRPFYGGIFLDRSLATSAKCFRFDFKMLSDGRAVLPAGGMGRIAEQLAQPLFAADQVHLRAQVESLVSEGDRVVGVRLTGGAELRGDAVVLATPAPEAARLSGLALPNEALAVTAIYYSGERPVYRGRKIALNAGPDALVNNAQQLTNIVPEYAPPGSHLLSATVLGDPPRDDAALYRAALADLHRMFAGDLSAQAALAQYQPLAIYRIPYAQFRQPPGIHPTLPDNRSGRPGLLFAAEFTEASSINAAMISGEKCAAAILAG
jgi:protoporphyrinogen oxidase